MMIAPSILLAILCLLLMWIGFNSLVTLASDSYKQIGSRSFNTKITGLILMVLIISAGVAAVLFLAVAIKGVVT